jgi:methionine-S-sulfoxide reductase
MLRRVVPQGYRFASSAAVNGSTEKACFGAGGVLTSPYRSRFMMYEELATMRQSPTSFIVFPGCFWGTEKFFKVDFPLKYPSSRIAGVRVGYMGPITAMTNPTYRDVCSGASQHVEVCEFTYQGGEVVFEALCRHFFSFHDPTTLHRQGRGVSVSVTQLVSHSVSQSVSEAVTQPLSHSLSYSFTQSLHCHIYIYEFMSYWCCRCVANPGNDVGSQYASVIFYHTEMQKQVAERVKADFQVLLERKEVRYSEGHVVTAVLPATTFYVAEPEHQGYLQTHPGGYCNHFYRLMPTAADGAAADGDMIGE